MMPVPIAKLLHQSQLKPFYLSALGSTVVIIAYGAFVSFGSTNVQFTAAQQSYNHEYILKYADGDKAIFKTDDGYLVVTVGAPLASAGDVVSIEQQDGRWKVTTSKHLSFVQD